MSSLTRHSSFTGLTEAGFQTYVSDLLNSTHSAPERKQIVAYLQQITSSDQAALDTERDAYRTKLVAQRKKQIKLDQAITEQQFDFSKTASIFSPTVITDTELTVLLAADDSEVFLTTRSVSGNMVVTGDRVRVDGGGSGDARTETLDSLTVFTGQLVVGANDVVVKGVKFLNTAQRAITFSAATANLVLEDCVFTADANEADSQWWFGGEDGYVSGNVTIRNCVVQGYKSWMLADLSTDSSIPTTKLDTVTIESNFFKGNSGSFAVRGMPTNPNDLVIFKNNKGIVANQHASFWDFWESNCQKRVEVTGNEVQLETVVGKVGIYQLWSQSPLPWTLYYKDNTNTNARVALKVGAHLTNFYSPNTADPTHLIDLNSSHTNCEFAYSAVYKRLDGTTPSLEKWVLGNYSPANIAVYPTIPVVYNPLGLATVVPEPVS